MRTLRLFGIIFSLFLLILLAGCSMLPFSGRSTPTPHPGQVLFSDDFSSSPNGWGMLAQEGGKAGFEYGGMVIGVTAPHSLFWTVNEATYSDTVIDVDAVLLDGSTNDNFGVICRYADSQNFYGFLISHDGYYGIFKMLNGQMVLSGENANLDYSEAIRLGGVVNHISAACQGDILKLTVNDVLLAEVRDSSFSSGQIGLIAGAYETAGIKVLFDNLSVIQP
jgi:hypothetical protein